MGNIVAIVGRPNVGKSTLFNRLVGERKAIVDDVSGVTRDRHYGNAEWQNREFIVIDTGGFVKDSSDVFESAINEQVEIAIEEADVLLFMVDVATGVTDLDQQVANLLRRTSKPVLVVVNKVDNYDRITDAVEFYSTGFDELFNISAITGSGTGELLEALVEKLGDEPEIEETELPKIAIIGRPNVGKSSLVNALLGKQRNIVTDVAGTTRDTIHTRYNAFGQDFLLVDTAGIRKKGKVHENIEFYSVMRSVKAIEDADVCVLMIDATEGIQAQELNLFYLAERNGKGIVILVNKWDLVENKQTNTAKEYEEQIKAKIAPFVNVPVIFISALNKQRIFQAVEKAVEVYNNLSNKISTSKINEVMLPIIEATPPPALKGKYIRIKYVTQLKTRAVSFAFFCNLPQYIKDPYKRFLENKLRQQFNFEGVPIRIYFRKK